MPLYILLIALAWLFRAPLHARLREEMALLAAVASGALLFVLLLPLVDFGHRYERGRIWRVRLAERKELPLPSPWWRRRRSEHEPLERLLAPLIRTPLGRALMGYWQDAGFGARAAYPLAAMTMTVLGGYLIGYLSTRQPLLGAFAAFLSMIGLLVLTYSRAILQRRRFGDQFPDVLERLADSLLAGFSLPQAIDFIGPNLPQPSAAAMARVSGQIALGYTVDEALGELYRLHPSEDVRLLVEGLTLQRRVGGDMPAMMREMAALVRGRVELENEVRTLTAQGRLSALVIALLVPVSLVVLSMFPGYVEVLFRTTIGNWILIIVGVLELIGAAIVARLIRIEY